MQIAPTVQGVNAGSLGSQSPAAAHLAAAHPTLSPFTRTVLLLMAEIARGKESPWHAYVATLPKDTGCLITWPPEDRRLLAGTTIEDKAKSPEEVYAAEIAPLLAPRPDLWPPAAGYGLFRRAAEVVQTRAFHMRAENWVTGAVQDSLEQLYLIPAMDVSTHAACRQISDQHVQCTLHAAASSRCM
ncbi:hypothetical protein MNEG_14792 [Monoraphidium neglectum]|uniref:Uncharacterized protein n=1 Tax=Monoraphidium neglectum TaxID=145388 RepID=A0A0D2IZC1_9CHLO|nr:hypothetical protein MNEG_14792 [Monoraphidium neglectum]KIY93172.1 hypothetical protein MNEG_14792 [Monoraphidium neglectum]|eukprot:XP_013892192.1 hypothetical protein MNEG_14792 [Monoraphidium neglectum]